MAKMEIKVKSQPNKLPNVEKSPKIDVPAKRAFSAKPPVFEDKGMKGRIPKSSINPKKDWNSKG
jgi:hypothetical protein